MAPRVPHLARRLVCAALLSVAPLGCEATTAPAPSGGPAASSSRAASPPAGECPLSTGAAPMKLPDFPEDAVLQYMSANREGEWRGFRILSDGRLLRTSREGAWEQDAPLSKQRLSQVRAALAEAPLQAGAERYGADPPPDDPSGWALMARLDGGAATRSGLGCRPGFVDDLIARIAPLLTP